MHVASLVSWNSDLSSIQGNTCHHTIHNEIWLYFEQNNTLPVMLGMIWSRYWICELILCYVFLDFHYRYELEKAISSSMTATRLFVDSGFSQCCLSQVSLFLKHNQGRMTVNFYGICVDCYCYLITRQCRWLGSIFFVHVLALAIYIPWYKMFANIGLRDNERRSKDGQADIPGIVLLMVLRDKLCTLGLFCVALTLWIENKI